MDAVYICRAGDNEELRYSLRSLRNVAHDAVWVFGGAPAWFKGRHVPVSQEGDKQSNAGRAVRAACLHPEVSDPFILMNDDFFAIEPVEVSLLDRGNLADVLAEVAARHPSSPWVGRMRRTKAHLASLGYEDPRSFELHVPIPVRKEAMLRAIEMAEACRGGLQWRSVYGALCGDPSTTIADVKVLRRGHKPDAGPWLSTNDITFADVEAKLARMFPEPSDYEEARMTTVRAVKRFRDTQAQVQRNEGDTFEVTPERAAFLADTPKFGALVEIVSVPEPRTVKDIKAILDARGIEYRSGATKAELLKLM